MKIADSNVSSSAPSKFEKWGNKNQIGNWYKKTQTRVINKKITKIKLSSNRCLL